MLQADMINADIQFQEAQKWLFFMVRALEYKWNEPFTNNYAGRTWQMSSLFKLRNADELNEMYLAMKNYDDLQVLSSTSDDRFDWFSVRKNFMGYYQTNGATYYFSNIVTFTTNDATESVTNTVTFTNAIDAFRYDLAEKVTNGFVDLDFSTLRELPNRSFFRGPTYFPNGDIDPTKPGSYLDKIRWMKIRLPGGQAQATTIGYLRYGGESVLRNRNPGQRKPDRPNEITDEMTKYSTRHWKYENGHWLYNDGLNAQVSMLIVPRTEQRLDGNPSAPDALPSVNQIDVFRERSVAATGWHLSIPVSGENSVDLSQLDDIEIYFYHWSFNR